MSRQIFIGLFTEGSTDKHFLESIVKRTFDEVALECNGEIETFLIPITINKTGLGFVDQVLEASKSGKDDFGITVLCVHTDSDSPNDIGVFTNKITPAINAITQKSEQSHCKIITAVVPIQMIEAWMLADKDLLKSEIGTDKTNIELGIHRVPENIADPKSVIESAIRIARAEVTRRRRKDLQISQLYQPIGQKIPIAKLDSLPSFLKFKEGIREAYRSLNCLQN